MLNQNQTKPIYMIEQGKEIEPDHCEYYQMYIINHQMS